MALIYTPNGVDVGTDINFSPDYKANPDKYVEYEPLPNHPAFDCIRFMSKAAKFVPASLVVGKTYPAYLYNKC